MVGTPCVQFISTSFVRQPSQGPFLEPPKLMDRGVKFPGGSRGAEHRPSTSSHSRLGPLSRILPLGSPMGVTPWGSWGGALFSPGLRPAVVCGHTTTPPGSGHPSGLSPSLGGRLPCGQVLSRGAGAQLCLHSSLRRCYRSLRTEIKTCILQVQIHCT